MKVITIILILGNFFILMNNAILKKDKERKLELDDNAIENLKIKVS